jgi:hypothetical protein
MRRFAIVSLFVLAITGTGCAGANSWLDMSDAEFIRRVRDYNQKTPKEEQIHCERIKPLGSHFYHWSCRYKWSMDAERLRTQDVIRRIKLPEGPTAK